MPAHKSTLLTQIVRFSGVSSDISFLKCSRPLLPHCQKHGDEPAAGPSRETSVPHLLSLVLVHTDDSPGPRSRRRGRGFTGTYGSTFLSPSQKNKRALLLHALVGAYPQQQRTSKVRHPYTARVPAPGDGRYSFTFFDLPRGAQCAAAIKYASPGGHTPYRNRSALGAIMQGLSGLSTPRGRAGPAP